ncbi:MscL family protein [Candidatus Microgenomates bacterium]|nr:MscL family protein [Candidatus Microgenomates bacterium]
MAERPKRKVRREGHKLQQEHLDEAVEKALEKALKTGVRTARGQVVGFFDFIRERGVIGLAVGIVIGSAVTALVRSLVDDIINPLIGLFLVSEDLNTSTIKLGGATISWGSFVSTLLDFLVIAIAVYIIFRMLGLEKLDKPKAKKDKLDKFIEP